ncbi:hypothetical protein [Brachyspira sp.]|uniref:hypothetical protein n=1 Tax=Brachyspira sp. TaxID=1977261 RepID=UPI003D7E85E8
MTRLTLREIIEERLNDDTIVIVRECEFFGKEIYFNYDAKKVSAVKTLSRREYCPAEKKWRSKSGVSEIKEKLQDYKLDFLFFFDKIEDASKYMIEDDFYMHHQDINFVLTTSIKEDEKDYFIEKFLKPHGLTIDETKKVAFEDYSIEKEYICLKLA